MTTYKKKYYVMFTVNGAGKYGRFFTTDDIESEWNTYISYDRINIKNIIDIIKL